MWRNSIFFCLLVTSFRVENGNGYVIDESRYSYDIPSRDSQYGYYVQLESYKTNSIERYCGGALISNEWILTSCNCIRNADRVVLRAGNGTGDGFVYTVDATSLYVHEMYQADHGIADIGLVKLPEFVKYSKTVQKIELSDRCDEESYSDDVLVVTSDFTQNEKEKINFPMASAASFKSIPFAKCQKNYPIFTSKSSKSVLCVESKASAKQHVGDGGRILIRPKGNQLIGVFNFCHGEFSDNDNTLVFRYVAAYYDFIAKHTGLDLPNCANDEFMI